MIFEGMAVGSMGSNCYLIGCEQTKDAVVVDPGAEGRRILSRLEKHGLKCTKVILTHGHADHIGALEDVLNATGAEVLIHEADAGMLISPAKNLSMYMGSMLEFNDADRLLKDGDTVEVGTITLEVMHTPGHTPGGICLKVGDNLITGDTLFAGSIGRSDFPGGDHNQLIRSIKNKLLGFPGQTRVYPGHGPASTIDEEKKFNPFLS